MDKFFINAYLAPPPKMEINNYDSTLMEKGYKKLSEAGFTHCLAYYEKYGENNSEVIRAISVANQNNISYIINDKSFCGKSPNFEIFENNLQKLANYDYAGHFLFDEAGRKQLNLLREMIDFYKSKTSKKLPYYNMQPLYSPPNYLEYGMWTKETAEQANYQTYLQDFSLIVSPEYLSFDFYPFYVGENIKEGYFTQLEIISNLAKKNGVPFYPYIQSCSWQSDVRIPTFAEVIWQCGMSMCYGAKGLQYFCFFTPYSNGENRRDVAMLDFNCEPTERYLASKVFNLFLKRIEPLVYNMEHLYTSCGEKGIVQVISGKCKIGLFKLGESLGVFITNALFDKNQTIEFKLEREYEGIIYGFEKDENFKNNTFKISLSAGESVFVYLR